MGEVEATARTLGLEVTPLEIRRAEDIAPAFEALKPQADALYVVVNALVTTNRTRIITLALGARLPTIFNTRDFVQAGALMSYGPNYPDMFRRTAELVDKILRGTKPGDIPVEQPTKFDLVINLTTAKALGLDDADGHQRTHTNCPQRTHTDGRQRTHTDGRQRTQTPTLSASS